VSKLLDHQVKLINEFGGYVDKFGGDGVMAVFDGPNMVVQSCLCALEISRTSHQVIPEESQRLWQSGIGIHTGRVVIGNIGSPDHLDYSAIATPSILRRGFVVRRRPIPLSYRRPFAMRRPTTRESSFIPKEKSRSGEFVTGSTVLRFGSGLPPGTGGCAKRRGGSQIQKFRFLQLPPAFS
jgi:hypothetical protein